MNHSPTTRRHFLASAGLAAVAPSLLSTHALAEGDRPPPSGRITMGTIGCGGQGTGDMNGFMGFPEVQMVAVCDPVPEHRERALKGALETAGQLRAA